MLERLLSGYRFGELDHDDAIALLQPVGQWIAEILIRVHGARWDVVADAPLSPVADIARRAEEQIQR